SEAAGRIRAIYVHDGDRVDAGDLLLQLETREFTMRQTSVESRIHFTELRLAELERQLEDANTTELRFGRMDRLFRTHRDLPKLYHELEQIRLDMQRLTITAPASGQIASLTSLHDGEILAPGMAIASIVPESPALVIDSWVAASDRSYIGESTAVRLRLDAP